MILEIVNPSDAVTIETDDVLAAGVGITLVGDGWYGLQDENGATVLPITAFGGFDEWAKKHGIVDSVAMGNYIDANREKIAAILESVAYGKISDRQMYNAAISKMTPEKAQEYRDEWNDKKRSSMTNIGRNCLATANFLRKQTNKLDKQNPTIFAV